MRYEDFVIQIGPDSGSGYSVTVVKSPAGEGEGVFKLPFSAAEMGPMLQTLAAAAELSRGEASSVTRNLSPAAAERQDLKPRAVGGSLFRSLFAGQVRSLFDQSLGKIEAVADRGLRIQLKLNPQHPDLARLYSLPWELLFRPDTHDFLSLSRLSPVVRYLDVSRPTSPYPLPDRLRILVAMANPRGLPPLDLHRERANLESAWGRHAGVETVFLPNASLGAIREELLDKPFHVIHFMGHAGFHGSSGEGVLYFEGSSGGPLPVSGQVLASKLKDFRSLRLVFVNACETARASSASGINPFAGVATALVLGGISAVVAMQFPISDVAAVAFSRAFYQRLAAGDSVDTAVTEGRQAVHSENAESIEWATPVLFLRSPDGNLFSREAAGAADAVPTRPAAGGMLTESSAGGGGSLGGLQGLNPTRRKGRWRWVAGLVSIVALAGLGLLAAQRNQGDASRQPHDLSGSVSAPNEGASPPGFGEEPGAPPPVVIRAQAPAVSTVYEVNQGFRSDIEGFVGLVSRIEMRGDRMRWYFHFFNQTDGDHELRINYGETYLADERGNRYSPLDAEAAPDLKERYRWTVQVGVRLDRWIEFAAPEARAKHFTVGIVDSCSGWCPAFRPFSITLPQ
jgi:hypothetical protein